MNGRKAREKRRIARIMHKQTGDLQTTIQIMRAQGVSARTTCRALGMSSRPIRYQEEVQGPNRKPVKVPRRGTQWLGVRIGSCVSMGGPRSGRYVVQKAGK